MDAIFKALGDPTRRALLDALRERDGRTLTELERSLAREGGGLTRFGVMKHLKVLEEASLVVSHRSGRFKHHYLNAVALQEVVDRWIEPLVKQPTARAMLDLKARLESNVDATHAIERRPDFVSETYIRTTPEALWKALGDETASRDYHFLGAGVRTDMLVGHRYDQYYPDGSIMLGGQIVEASPYSVLETTFEPHWMPDAKPSRCRFEIEEVGDLCRLTVKHFDLPEGQDGVRDGWVRFMASLKSWLETGEGLRFAA